jgi:hypothetical protein
MSFYVIYYQRNKIFRGKTVKIRIKYSLLNYDNIVLCGIVNLFNVKIERFPVYVHRLKSDRAFRSRHA